MSLTSDSTDAQVWAAYDDNASYEEDGSRAKALAFITACRIILRRRPSSMSRSDANFSFESVSSEMTMARKWLIANPDTSSASGRRDVRYGSLENFRDEF